MDLLKSGAKVVGLKQSHKAVRDGTAKLAFVARDAEPDIRQPFEALCRERGLRIEYANTCLELGKACGIEVGCAIAALLS